MDSRRRPDLVSFHATDDGTLRVTDDVTETTLELYTPEPVSLQSALPALFYVPVDDAVSFETDELVVGPHASLHVRDEAGDHLGELNADTDSYPRATYFLDVFKDLKAFVRIDDAAFSTRYTPDETHASCVRFSFDRTTTVTVGARSTHTEPNTTITVPDDPVALMEAVSYAGCGVKEWTAERSWPTLRGHPPAYESGESLRVPDALSKPDTGVTVEVPERYGDVLRVAPLAHYLGATVEPGERARLVLDNGYTHDLGEGRRLEAEVEHVLARAVLLDSLVRIGGYFSQPRQEYEEIAPHLPFYPEALYDEPVADALVEYLEVDTDTIARFGLTWPTVGVLPPTTRALPVLSSLLHALVPIHVTDSETAGNTVLNAEPAAYATESRPEGAAYVTRRSFENARRNPVPENPTFTIVAGDRAERYREFADSEVWPRLPSENVTVHETPPETTGDCLVLDAPVRDRPAFDTPPRVLVARADNAQHVDALLEAGTVAAVTYDGDPSPRALAEFLATLFVGVPVGHAARVALDAPARLHGDPRTALRVLPNGASPYEATVRSLDTDEHRVAFRQFSLSNQSFGGTGRADQPFFPDTVQLMDCTTTFDHVFDTDDVIEMLADHETLVDLNGDLFLGTHPPTADDVERSARRANADELTDDLRE